MVKALDLTGKKFGALTTLYVIGFKPTVWKVVCDCGNYYQAVCGELVRGTTNNCGCLTFNKRSVIHKKHGMFGTATYAAWASMLIRCKSDEERMMKSYKGRGIKVCKRWHKFENFLKDMGARPDNLTLDRKNNNKGYSKDNCRWATREEQQNNRTNSRKFGYQGGVYKAAEIAKILELNPLDANLYSKLNRLIEKKILLDMRPNSKEPNP